MDGWQRSTDGHAAASGAAGLELLSRTFLPRNELQSIAPAAIAVTEHGHHGPELRGDARAHEQLGAFLVAHLEAVEAADEHGRGRQRADRHEWLRLALLDERHPLLRQPDTDTPRGAHGSLQQCAEESR
eukprot:CAMPEP_0179903662 /NCGR_PEP_ID=MMETSP0982-20121206/41408_1 /TAXON_ID=483367 /ORGANISM="non described non described, Strain CCMP 2436" /LENGTH=128 /DNA_ID=CAMNT_0021803273 /DNA_START=263 /DNA_END=645 /DNA_ORIENTATION=-